MATNRSSRHSLHQFPSQHLLTHQHQLRHHY